MDEIELVIKIPEEEYEDIINSEDCGLHRLTRAIAKGTLLPKGHGRLIDISKLDNDRIESDNPIIYLTINGEYIEAVSLDYLYSLQTIIEADKAESEDKE